MSCPYSLKRHLPSKKKGCCKQHLFFFDHLAAHRSLKKANQIMLPRPKWYKKKPEKRHSTGDLINNIKAQLWARGIGLNFSGFVSQELKTQSQRNAANPCTSAMFYMRN